MTRETSTDQQLRELWDLVGELDVISKRLQEAADKAVEVLEVPPEQLDGEEEQNNATGS